MSKVLLTVCAFGLLLSSAFAEEKSPEQYREESSHIFGIEGQASQSFTRTIASGAKQRIGFYAPLNPDCTASGDVTVRVTKQTRTWDGGNRSYDRLHPLCKRKYPL
jgi:hypothetical protein